MPTFSAACETPVGATGPKNPHGVSPYTPLNLHLTLPELAEPSIGTLTASLAARGLLRNHWLVDGFVTGYPDETPTLQAPEV